MKHEVYNGWAIAFMKNIHMYCHSLTMEKDGRQYTIPCEDSPLGSDLVIMWIFELTLEGPAFQDLLTGLREWADRSGMKYRIYTSMHDYETNEGR